MNNFGFAAGELTFLLVVGLVGILLFLLFRSILLWYWKIDKIVERLESIDYHLGQLNQKNHPSSIESTPGVTYTPSSKLKSKVNTKSAFKNFEPLKDE